MGNHPSKGLFGVIVNIGKMSRDGVVESYIVKLHVSGRSEEIPLLNLKWQVHDLIVIGAA